MSKKKTQRVRTRIAPSPTGFAHVGTAYAALFNLAYARKNKGSFILRIEDTDVKRNIPGAEEAIYAGLSWLGLDWDEGPDKGGKYKPYRQSERLALYQRYAKKLVKGGRAYKEEGAIRFKSDIYEDYADRWITWEDLVRGQINFHTNQLTDFVLLKSDGYPTYNFAVVVDDHLMDITHVIRGEEHISNTHRQIALYKAFGWNIPEFAHFPSLRNEKRQKLSKRRDPVDLRIYREEGYLPEALSNFLCLLGWSHPEEKEIFSLSEFVKHFTIARIRKAGPIFDARKLEWINGEYIRRKTDEELAHLLFSSINTPLSEEELISLAPLVRERIKKLSEAESLLEFFWEEPRVGRELFEDAQAVRHVASALNALSGLKKWTLEEINAALEDQIKKKSFKTGKFYMSLRIAITGKRVTPPLNQSMLVLGQDKVLHRLEEAQKVLVEIEPPEIA